MKKSDIKLFPEHVKLLDFNYTDTTNKYTVPSLIENLHIHGTLEKPVEMIFGYGDELDKDYKELFDLNDTELLKNSKSVQYLQTGNYRNLLEFLDSAPYQVFVMGHSCGLSDRTLLNSVFEHENCISIKPFYHKYKDKDGVEKDDFMNILQNIYRNFENKSLFRDKVVNKERCVEFKLDSEHLTFAVPGTNGKKSVEFRMNKVIGGTVQMSRKFKVTLDDYYMGETPVTQELWRAVMEGTEKESPSLFKGEQRPVERVSWNDITEEDGFLDRLNKALEAQLPDGMKFSLPTEAQWEFAVRDGVSKIKEFEFSGSDDIDEVAWYGKNSKPQTHHVKEKKANGLGLYDMSGNVWEWCKDRYEDYPEGEINNYEGPDGGQGRVMRGGSWFNSAEVCRCADRNWLDPDGCDVNVGLRLALS